MEQINEAVEKRAGGTRLKKKGGIGGPLLTALALTAEPIWACAPTR